MRVVVDNNLFSPPVAHLQLFELFALARSGRHILLSDPPFDVQDAEPINTWLASLDERTRREIEQVLEQCNLDAASLPRDQCTIRVVSSGPDWGRGHLLVDTALRLLREPLHILLENSRNDRAFLMRLAPLVHRQRLERALADGWVVVDNGGGLGEMTQFVDELISAPNNDEQHSLRRLRTWLLFDRDSSPQDRRDPSAASEALCERAQQHTGDPWPLAHHQLGRRSIENYLPREILEQWSQERSGRQIVRGREACAALAQMRRDYPEAAHQLDMKDGLLGDVQGDRRRALRTAIDALGTREAQPPETLARIVVDDALPDLFQGLPPEVRGALVFGFGRDIADQYGGRISDWDEAFEREYVRGPTGQPSRREILESLLRRL